MAFSTVWRARTRLAFTTALTVGTILPVALASTPGFAQTQSVQVAQSQEAQLLVRLQQLEEQVRTLTGQVEGLQFQLTQMQTLLERQNEDNEYRFQALEGGEGGAGGKTEAAPQPSGVTPSGETPQSPENAAPSPEPRDIPEQGVVPLPGEAEIDPSFDDTQGAPMDDLGTSRDPLLGTGQGAEGVPLGTPAAPAPQAQASPQAAVPNTGGTVAAAPSGAAVDPAAQATYSAGYNAIMSGDFVTAETQFRQFLDAYPTDAQAPDATNWLGEALIQRGEFDQAADVLLAGYQKFQQSNRAPDLLLKLGIALNGAQESETACRTFTEVGRRYPSVSPAFAARLQEEMSKARCQ